MKTILSYCVTGYYYDGKASIDLKKLSSIWNEYCAVVDWANDFYLCYYDKQNPSATDRIAVDETSANNIIHCLNLQKKQTDFFGAVIYSDSLTDFLKTVLKSIKELYYQKFRSSFLEELDLGLIQSLGISADTLDIWFELQGEVLIEHHFKYTFKGAYLVVSVESQPAKPDATHNGVYQNTQEYAWLQAVEFCEEFLKSQEFQIAKAKHDLNYLHEIDFYEKGS